MTSPDPLDTLAIDARCKVLTAGLNIAKVKMSRDEIEEIEKLAAQIKSDVARIHASRQDTPVPQGIGRNPPTH